MSKSEASLFWNLFVNVSSVDIVSLVEVTVTVSGTEDDIVVDDTSCS